MNGVLDLLVSLLFFIAVLIPLSQGNNSTSLRIGYPVEINSEHRKLDGSRKREVWLPSKDKAEFDEEYKSGVWSDKLNDNSFKQTYAIPIERMRYTIIAGVYFQMYSRDLSTSTILDVGCGNGLMTEYLRPEQVRRYTGIDVSAIAVEQAKRRQPTATFIQADLEHFIPPVNMKYNMIVFSEALYYVNHVEAIKKYSNYLTKGGVIVVSIWHNEHRPHVVEAAKSIIIDIESLGNLKKIDSVKLKGDVVYVDHGKQLKPPGDGLMHGRVFDISIYRVKHMSHDHHDHHEN